MGASHRFSRLSLIGGAILHAAVAASTAADIIRTNAFGLGADAEIREQNGGTELRGDHWELAARYSASHNQHMMVRFDLSGIATADLIANSISDLRLFVNRNSWSTGAGTFQYYALNPDAANQLWNESTVNFQNAPGLSYDGVMTTRGFTSDTTLVGELAFSGAKPPGTALDFSSAALTNVVLSALDYYNTHGGTPVLTMFVALKEGSPAGQNYIVKSKNADSTLGTGLLTGAQYNPQLVLRSLVVGNSETSWRGGTGQWSDATKWSLGYPPQNSGDARFDVTVNAGSFDVVTLDTDATVDRYHHAQGMLTTGTAEKTLTVMQKLVWSGGTFQGSTGRLNIDARGGMDFVGSGHGYLENVTIANHASAGFNTASVVFTHTATLRNMAGATFDIQGGTALVADLGSPARFENSGTVQKKNASDRFEVMTPFFNDGTVIVDNGTLVFSGRSVHGGTYHVGAGATLVLGQGYALGTQTLSASGLITGPGNLQITESAIYGTIANAGDVVISRKFNTFQPGAVLQQGGNLKFLPGSSVSFDTGGTVFLSRVSTDSYSPAGHIAPPKIEGNDNIVFNDLLVVRGIDLACWDQNHTPDVILNGGMTINGDFDADTVVTNRHLINNSTIRFESGWILLGGNATIENQPGAVFDLANDNLSIGSESTFGGLPRAFNNYGLVVKSAGTGQSRIFFGNFLNYGTVSVRSGELLIQDGNSGTGLYSVDPGASLRLAVGMFVTGAKVSGAGQLMLEGTGTPMTVAGEVDVQDQTHIIRTVNFLAGAKLTNFGTQLILKDRDARATFATGTTVFVNDLSMNSGRILGSDLIVVRGTASGAGTFEANVTIEGKLSPKDTTWAQNFYGTLQLTDQSTLALEIASATEWDRINSYGLFSIDGSLQVSLLAGFAPSNGKAFAVVTSFSPIAGVFDNVSSGGRLDVMDGAGSFRVYYGVGSPLGANKLILTDFQVPEPASIGMWLLMAPLLSRPRRR